MLTKITNIDSFDKLLDSKEFFFFLKHSNTCPISAGAFEEFQKFHYERDIDGYYLIVQDHRELSNYISEKYDIKHESRSEEHTSELQSRFDLVCRLLILRCSPCYPLFPYTTLFRSVRFKRIFLLS